jgi:hypothetical protein
MMSLKFNINEIVNALACLAFVFSLVMLPTSTSLSIGFPRMALGKEGVFLAWTAPEDTISQHPQGGTTIKVAFLGMQ